MELRGPEFLTQSPRVASLCCNFERAEGTDQVPGVTFALGAGEESLQALRCTLDPVYHVV